MPRIFIADALSPRCQERLSQEADFDVDFRPGLSGQELRDAVHDAEGLVVRSATRVDGDLLAAAPVLKVVGRAGEGVDNIDVDQATERGVVVMNTPGGNTISAAEQTFCLLLALARHLPDASRSVREGRWERARFLGTELYGKVLGVVGLGKIGREVAARARAFGMEVLGHDPFLPEEQAERLQLELHDLDTLLEKVDFLTVHAPRTTKTKHLIGREEIARMPRGVRLINCARGGLYDEQAVADAIREGHVAGAAFDVFEAEPPDASPLPQLEQVICTPHLGASTQEAQEKVAIRIAEQIIQLFRNGTADHALNVDSVDPQLRARLDPYRALCEQLGRLHAQLLDAPLREIQVEFQGAVRDLPTRPITAALLKGYLEGALSEPVNQVNAWVIAERVGISVTEVLSGEHADFSNLITATFRTAGGDHSVSGTLFGRHLPRIVRLEEYHLEIVPEGDIFLFTNDDRPGMIGKVGSILGGAGVNIAHMSLGRDRSGGEALAALNTDSQVSDEVATQVAELPGILSVRRARL
jgi:D-3-phosphoglycerate dehydrogenase